MTENKKLRDENELLKLKIEEMKKEFMSMSSMMEEILSSHGG
jgi:hypothetical protein